MSVYNSCKFQQKWNRVSNSGMTAWVRFKRLYCDYCENIFPKIIWFAKNLEGFINSWNIIAVWCFDWCGCLFHLSWWKISRRYVYLPSGRESQWNTFCLQLVWNNFAQSNFCFEYLTCCIATCFLRSYPILIIILRSDQFHHRLV